MNTASLVKDAAARFKHSESKLLLQEKYTARLVIAHSGGMWQITPQFLAFLRTSQPYVVITDIYDTPHNICTVELLELAERVYESTMREWLEEHTQLSRKR